MSDLPEKGLTVTEQLPESSINSRLSEPAPVDGTVSSVNQFIFTGPLNVTITAIPYGNEGSAKINGSLTATYTQDCSLCLDNLPRILKVPIEFQVQKMSDGETGTEDDVGICFYQGDNAELDPILEEAAILALSIFWHPPFIENRCTECRKSRAALGLAEPEAPLSLADLLAKAAAKQNN